MRIEIEIKRKKLSKSDKRILKLGQGGFSSIAEAHSAIVESFPNARYITPFSAIDFFLKRGDNCEVFVINRPGAFPRTAKLIVTSRAGDKVSDDSVTTQFPAIGDLPQYAVDTIIQNKIHHN